jgi:hypothetical protein
VNDWMAVICVVAFLGWLKLRVHDTFIIFLSRVGWVAVWLMVETCGQHERQTSSSRM